MSKQGRVSLPRALLGAILTSLIFTVPLLGLDALISHFWPNIALYAHGTLVGLSIVWFILIFFNTDTDLNQILDEDGPEGMAATFAAFTIFVVSSSLFLGQWSLQYGGFTPHSATYLSWLAYGTSWILDNLLANFGQIYGRTISDIQPITVTTRSLVWGYNVLLDIVGITTVVRVVRLMRIYRATEPVKETP